ncbi:hypothetical protein P154DRAFT_41173 [Amniculicola lignicola CBS 123094]|uniref:Uncharacterized protein n=1 Tax=Amniculicola lignicola CBS 123094 TaxID=1392246 RepID=A0A6A5VXE3_9PLEO|nr:hypothetical protein P154DRAFT_41173 [Amniculicola lignicola CBS 123094]
MRRCGGAVASTLGTISHVLSCSPAWLLRSSDRDTHPHSGMTCDGIVLLHALAAKQAYPRASAVFGNPVVSGRYACFGNNRG